MKYEENRIFGKTAKIADAGRMIMRDTNNTAQMNKQEEAYEIDIAVLLRDLLRSFSKLWWLAIMLAAPAPTSPSVTLSSTAVLASTPSLPTLRPCGRPSSLPS